MRIGLIGLGRIGLMHAANAVADDEVSELLLTSRDPAKAEREAAALGEKARARATLEDVLAEADGLLVATSTATHPDIIRASIAAGVPVLCEKPAAMDRPTLAALARDVEASGVPVLIAFQRRYDPAYRRLREEVAAGAVGRPQLVRTVAHDRVPPPPEYIPTSGGIWRDLLIHDFDAVPWVLGERVVEVYAQGNAFSGSPYTDCGDADAAVAVLTFASGARALVSGARANGQGYDCRIEVFGDRATLAAGVGPRTPVASLEEDAPPPAEPHQGFPERFDTAYKAQIRQFVEVVRGRAENPSPPGDGLHALEIATACELSRRLNRPVAVTEDGQLV
ncbi:Gfo/Idh/MocA family protein [Streptomyces macrosporus]|uniref:Gfo/Idh/MocA family oxidoreductase n=1 Tax=Streptomyces macrosporus TaxID=44032 RepID=A0ABP5WTF6_9ACTN